MAECTGGWANGSTQCYKDGWLNIRVDGEWVDSVTRMDG